jgi:hypothetical protein
MADALKWLLGLPLTFTDAAFNLADTPAAILGYCASMTADAMTMGDSSAGFYTYLVGLTDGTVIWGDSRNGVLTYSTIPAADDFNSWLDSLTFSQLAQLVAALTDSLNAWVDSPVGFLTYAATITDPHSVPLDSLAGFFTYAASLSPDNLNNLLDSFNAVAPGVGQLIAAFLDSMAAWDDTDAGKLVHNGALLDDWSQLADSLTIGGIGGGNILYPMYIIIGHNQAGLHGPSIGSL